jgi:hypothetical protein
MAGDGVQGDESIERLVDAFAVDVALKERPDLFSG